MIAALRAAGLWRAAVLLGVGALTFGSIGCTQGAVTDAESGELVSGANVRFFNWPPGESDGPRWVWPLNHRIEIPDFATESASASWNGANYGLGASGPCVQDVRDVLAPNRWYRVRIDRTGYLPGIFYRFHGGYDEQCEYFQCETGEMGMGECHVQNFELRPEGTTFPLMPDLIVDPRDLDDNYWQCALMPNGHEPLIGMRVSVATANVGMGPIHLKAADFDGINVEGARVVQTIEWSDGRLEERDLPDGAFEFHTGHNHIHFKDWVQMKLTRPTPDCDDRANRGEECVLATGEKISFCIMDYRPFDNEIRSLFNGHRRYPDPPTCDSLEQGMSPGWKDVYSSRLDGQAIVLGTADDVNALLDEYWLEVEADPFERVIELDRSNNFTRRMIKLPDDPASLCSDHPQLIDCSVPRSQYTTWEQRYQCLQYLRYMNGENR